MNILKALEMARSAKINLGNMVKTMPILQHYPLVFIVEDQINECIKELELIEKRNTRLTEEIETLTKRGIK